MLGLGAQPYNVDPAAATNGEVVIFLTWDDPIGRLAQQLRSVPRRAEHGPGRRARARTCSAVRRIRSRRSTTSTAARPDIFHIVVQNVQDQAQPRKLNLFSFQPECASDGPRLLAQHGRHERHNYNTATRSVSAQSDAGGSPVSA